MEKIKFPSFVDEEQKQMLVNLAEMKEGKMMITVNGEEMELDKALANASKEGQKGIETLLDAAKPKSIEDIQESQLDVLGEINTGIALFTGVIPASLAASKEGEAITRGLGKTVKTGSEKVFDKMTKEKGTFGITQKIDNRFPDPTQINNFNDLGTAIKNLANDPDIIEAKENIIEITEKISNLGQASFGIIQTGGVNLASLQQIVDAAQNIFKIEDAIISPKMGTFKTLKEDDLYVGTGLSEMITKLENLKSVSKSEPIETTITDIANKKPEVVSSEKKVGTGEGKIDITIKIDAPPQIDTEIVKKTMKDTLFVQEFIGKMKEVTSNFNLT